MKKELREEIKKDQIRGQKSKLSRLIDDNKGVVTALGIASFVALAGYSASQLLKDEKLMKKIKDGLKTPKNLKFLEKFMNESKEKVAQLTKKSGGSDKTEKKAKPSETDKPKSNTKSIASVQKAAPLKTTAPAKNSAPAKTAKVTEPAKKSGTKAKKGK